MTDSTAAIEHSVDLQGSLVRARKILAEVWGYDSFRPLQEEAVADVIAGRDSLVVLPTGGGKSLCYQVPALVRSGMSVVVSPLISLMKDQVDALCSNGVQAALVNSSQSDEEKIEVANRIRRGEIRILYLAPERLLTNKTLDFLKRVGVGFFAIDEAHCVSAWGHDFRPEYRGLRVLKQHFPEASIHAFTATASQRVREDIIDQLGLNQPNVLIGSFDRPNLIYRMIPASGKLNQIRSVIDRYRGASGIVYCISRREVDQTAAALNQLGFAALPYHAGLSDEVRKANQDAFIKERVDVIVATVAFGMGIDKSNVRFVIHAGMPKSIEHYQQESGRAGRDGLASECILLHSTGDIVTWKRILQSGEPTSFRDAMNHVNAMADLARGVRCRHAAIVEYFGEEYDAENCNACDVCLGEIDGVEDPVTTAQKILSCVVRLQERHGAAHTTNVLLGSREQRITEYGHDQLSTFGLLADEDASTIRLWIDQLASQGFLDKVGEYSTLQMTPSGRRLLRREGNVILTKANGTSKRESGLATPMDDWNGVDRGLFDRLRALRMTLASERAVPAYVICGDAVLRDLARIRPSTLDRLAQVRGIGQRKLDDFGTLFLECLNEACSELSLSRDNQPASLASSSRSKPPTKALNTSAVAAFAHFEANESIETVAAAMGRATSTVSGYLFAYLIEKKIIDPSPWVDLDEQHRIEAALAAHEGDDRLRPIFESLGGEIGYESIRIVAACRRNRMAVTPAEDHQPPLP